MTTKNNDIKITTSWHKDLGIETENIATGEVQYYVSSGLSVRISIPTISLSVPKKFVGGNSILLTKNLTTLAETLEKMVFSDIFGYQEEKRKIKDFPIFYTKEGTTPIKIIDEAYYKNLLDYGKNLVTKQDVKDVSTKYEDIFLFRRKDWEVYFDEDKNIYPTLSMVGLYGRFCFFRLGQTWSKQG